MSDDEFLIAVVAAAVALAFWGAWLATAAQTHPLVRPGRRLAAAGLVLLASLAVVAVALLTGADPQVRSGPGYVSLFLAVAADTLALVTLIAPAFGLAVLGGFVRERNAAKVTRNGMLGQSDTEKEHAAQDAYISARDTALARFNNQPA